MFLFPTQFIRKGLINVNKLKKILSMLLAAVLLVSCLSLATAEEPQEEIEFPDELIVSHPTITKGDFFTEMFGNDTADIDVRALIHGYNLVNWDQNQGTYVFDPSVVREVLVGTDNDGYRQYTIRIADNLKFSDGTPITAWDYAFSFLLMMSPEIEEIGGKIYRAEHLVDYDEYIAARRKAMAGEPLDPDKDLDYLTAVTVLSDYQLRIWLDPDFLPYFFEIGLLMTVPYPIDVIAPGCKVVYGFKDLEDNPLGIKIVNAENSVEEPVLNEQGETVGYRIAEKSAPIYTADLLKKTILDPETGYNTFPAKVSGPYVIKSWDGVTGHFEINPEFKGAWMVNNLPGGALANAWEKAREQGRVVKDTDSFGNPVQDAEGNDIELVLPSIEKIAFTVADNDTVIEEIAAGEKHLVNKVTYKETVEKGLAGKGEGAVDYQAYPRIGLAFLTFTYDWKTVNEKEVRQAIAWCMDRDLLTEEYCGANGLRVDGYFGLEQWEYQLLTRRIGFPVNFLPEADAIGTPIEYEEDELERMLKLKNRWVRSEAEYEAAVKAWDALADEWDDGETSLLTKYTVDLEQARKLLDRAGWTLNRNGETFNPETDDVRCKKIGDELVALDLKMMYPAGNHMADFMSEEGNFVDNLAQVGIKLTLVPTAMEDLLRSYYREADRTTDMIYLATNFHVIVDPAITYSTDKTVGHTQWNNTYSDDEYLFDLAVDMRKTEPGDVFQYVSKWMSFQRRYNDVLPTIPVYSNIYYDFYTPYLQNYVITAQVTWSQAILLAYFGLPETEAPADEVEAVGENETVFD